MIAEDLETYLAKTRERIEYVRENIPEHWAHEQLREIETLCKVHAELDAMLTANDPGRESHDRYSAEYKVWLDLQWCGRGSSIPDIKKEEAA